MDDLLDEDSNAQSWVKPMSNNTKPWEEKPFFVEYLQEKWFHVRIFFRDIRLGLKNLIRYAPIIWRDRDWDHTYLAALLEFKFLSMAKCLEKGNSLNGHKTANDLRVCSEICRRIRIDEYEDLSTSYKSQQEEQEYLGRLIGKHFSEWWD